MRMPARACPALGKTAKEDLPPNWQVAMLVWCTSEEAVWVRAVASEMAQLAASR